jgi:hypothetical protein
LSTGDLIIREGKLHPSKEQGEHRHG